MGGCRYYSDTPEMINACLNCYYDDCVGYDGTLCKRLKMVMWRGKEMTLNEYQQLAQRTSRKGGKKKQIENGILGICGEGGECADILKKHLHQGHGKELDTAHMIEELGDVMWYCCELASGLGVSLEDVAVGNIEKLKKRYPDGFSEERSINRED